MEFVIISGLSGAGKSRAASIMEDMGFFCVDNLPAPLIPKFAELGMAGNGEYDRVVLVTDIRGGTRFDSLFQALDGLRAMQCAYSILFMEATDEVIIQRYKETRRSHPLADECDSLEEAIALERDGMDLTIFANSVNNRAHQQDDYRYVTNARCGSGRPTSSTPPVSPPGGCGRSCCSCLPGGRRSGPWRCG